MISPENEARISGAETQAYDHARAVYLRPFVLFWLNSLVAETIFLLVGVFIMTGTDDLFHKVLWTLLFCPLGMGGAMGGLIAYFIVDQYQGHRAAHFTAWIGMFVFGSCNYLCYNLDRHFGWFGATEHPWWFHWRYPMIYLVGWTNGKLMFTERGQRKLEGWGM
jgi:hypothetical protein